MGKMTNLKITGIILISLIGMPLIIGMYLIDIGINSKYFIKKDFNKISQTLLTGDCEYYEENYRSKNSKSYLLGDEKYNLCTLIVKSTKEDNDSVMSLKVNAISHKSGSSTARIQVQVITRKDIGAFNLNLVKENFQWKIHKVSI